MNAENSVRLHVVEKHIQFTSIHRRVSTTVRIPRRASRKLDRLAARILLQTGRKIPKQELVDLILEVGLDEEALLAGLLELRLPLDDTTWDRVREKSTDWGVVTREEEVDRSLYGASE